MEIFTLAAMEKQRRYPGVNRCARCSLPTISEETDRAVCQKGLVNSEELARDTFRAMEKRENCNWNKQSTKEVHQETVKGEDDLFEHICILTDDSNALPKHQLKTLRLDVMNEVRALFPDFFPRSAIQDSCEDYSWKAKPTMEQIFSGHFSEKYEFKEESFEYWKTYKLSF